MIVVRREQSCKCEKLIYLQDALTQRSLSTAMTFILKVFVNCSRVLRLIELCRDCTIAIVTCTNEAMATDNGSSHNRAGIRIHTISLIMLLQTSHMRIVHCIHEKSAHANAVKISASRIGAGFLPTHYRWLASCKVHWLSSMLLATAAIHKLIHQCIVIQHCNHKYCNCLVLSYNSQMCGAVDSSFSEMVFSIQVCAIMCNVVEAHCYALGELIVSNCVVVSINN